MIDGFLVAARFVHFAALVTLFGSSIFVVATGGPALPSWITRSAAVVVLVSALAWLVAVAASMSGRPLDAVDWATLQLVLSATAFGMVWRLQLALAAAIVVAVWSVGRGGNTVVLDRRDLADRLKQAAVVEPARRVW